MSITREEWYRVYRIVSYGVSGSTKEDTPKRYPSRLIKTEGRGRSTVGRLSKAILLLHKSLFDD